MDTGFGTGKQPPAPLATAISNAATQYQVPTDLLAGIWREEAGGAYPNNAVNSSGYGGLFGTSDWSGPIQQQANLSASILASGLRAAGGNIAEALSYYNTGKLSGGYTSVPGETSFGTIAIPTAGGGSYNPVQTPPVGSGVTASIGGASSSSSPATGELTAVLKEAALRLLLVLGGIFLIVIGLKALNGAWQGPPVFTVNMPAGAR